LSPKTLCGFQDRLDKCYAEEKLEAIYQAKDKDDSDGYTTETDTLTEVSVHQAKN